MIVCPSCKGKGEVWDTGSFGTANPIVVIFTLGFSLMDGKKRCPICRGKGFIKDE